MMRTTLLLNVTLSAGIFCAAAFGVQVRDDPFLWLEQVDSPRAMNWVRVENAKTLKVLEADPHYAPFLRDARQIAQAQDRIPTPHFLDGQVYNFWQDEQHAHGIWRKTTLEDYRAPNPSWQTVLDLDALSKSEHANWFWKGDTCQQPAQHVCLLALSDGGEDAVELREFDLRAGAFVKGGFKLPRSKQFVAWQDANTVLVSREWVKGELTKSGYPFVVKRLQRGQPLDEAAEVFRGKPEDVLVAVNNYDDGEGRHAVFIDRGRSFFATEHLLLGPEGAVKLRVPLNSDILGVVHGRVIVSLHEAWTAQRTSLPQGSVAAFELTAAAAHPDDLRPALVYAPGTREAFVEALIGRGRLIVHTLDNVNGRAYCYTPSATGGWSKLQLALPDKVALTLEDADVNSSKAFVSINGFLSPSQLLLVDLADGSQVVEKTLPAKFDASKDVVEQLDTASKDGTRIPYFVVHPIGMKMDGTAPTILYAYGGFLVPMTPRYDAELGKLWLERGGSYVLANIRGGGEFGPAWHDAGLKTHRQRIYDDFAAVGQDLVTRGFTSPARLGIRGGSNGGLLVGVEFTQHPEMWGAVAIEVPLLDMLRYEQIAAGASWVAEYGSVSDPAQRAFLASISPYNNLRSGVHYPQPLLWTTSKDDRVGPQHARKFAAKLASMGLPYLYYEVIEGGHASGVTLSEEAQTAARDYTYFARQLDLNEAF